MAASRNEALRALLSNPCNRRKPKTEVAADQEPGSVRYYFGLTAKNITKKSYLTRPSDRSLQRTECGTPFGFCCSTVHEVRRLSEPSAQQVSQNTYSIPQ